MEGGEGAAALPGGTSWDQAVGTMTVPGKNPS